METLETKKKRAFPHSLVIIFLLICVAAIMTWVVPAGEYVRVEDALTGRMVVDPNSYHVVESNPANLFDVFVAIPRGLSEAGWIAWMVLIIGGSFHVIESTQSTRALIGKFMKTLKGRGGIFFIPVLMLPFFMLPAITGNGESMLAFLPLGILIARSMGFDAMTGCASSPSHPPPATAPASSPPSPPAPPRALWACPSCPPACGSGSWAPCCSLPPPPSGPSGTPGW